MSCESRRAHQLCTTWVELAIAFQQQAGYQLGGSGSDLCDQADGLRKMVMRIWALSTFHIQGVKVSAKLFWLPSRGDVNSRRGTLQGERHPT